MPISLENIKHIVVLMMENRSFDHMLGFFKPASGSIEGLSGAEFNPEDPSANPIVKVQVSADANYSGDLKIDPSHEVVDVNVQLFGNRQGMPGGADRNFGFVVDYAQQDGNNPHQA